jgi:hypothetical protein
MWIMVAFGSLIALLFFVLIGGVDPVPRSECLFGACDLPTTTSSVTVTP